MHSSWFSYPVSRAYPFRWFTPVTVAGGLVLTVLFTLVNLASSGFYLKPIFTDDPNGTTTAEPQWFMKAPFNWESNLDTQCQAKMLSVGDRFFTTNLGFQYTVKAISVTDDSENPKPLPSVPYLNNTLQDCFLSEVVLKLRKTDTAPSGTFWLSWTASTNDATASCLITTDLGTVNLTLGVEYEAINSRQYPYILQDNHTTHATTWWGTRLLNPYWAGVWEAMSKTQLDDDTYWSYGSVTYFRNQSISDIRSIDFLGVVAWFLASDGNISNPSGIRLPFLKENPDHFSNSVIYEGRHYAKILHSLVAADLGNCDSPSLLRDEDGLQYAILAPDDPNRDPGGPLNNSETGGDPNRYTKIPRPGTAAHRRPDVQRLDHRGQLPVFGAAEQEYGDDAAGDCAGESGVSAGGVEDTGMDRAADASGGGSAVDGVRGVSEGAVSGG
ncbi:hypothetical protein ACJZ2D_015256 [Fusarium nematophilum]